MEKINIGLEWFMNPDHIPIMVSLKKGWFKEENLEIEMIEPREHFDAKKLSVELSIIYMNITRSIGHLFRVY